MFFTFTYSALKMANVDFWLSFSEEKGLKRVLEGVNMDLKEAEIYSIIDLWRVSNDEKYFNFYEQLPL